MRTIGRYTIHGLLGRGGMGKIYKVTLPVIEKVVALKLLDPDPLLEKLMGADKLRKLFIHEARILAGLNHPNIVTVNDFDEMDGKLFYVMDYYAGNIGSMIGESYQVEKASRILPVDKALHYTRQTLLGLACLHDSGIVHRDIKPFNLLVTAEDTIKICDFGLSKLRGETYDGPANLNVGSPYYAAPEQENSPDSVEPSADLYPVGVMLYRMLTGNLPETGKAESEHSPVSRFNPDLDQRWDQFLSRAMAIVPTDRFQSAGEMMASLDALNDHWQSHKDESCRLMPEGRSLVATAPMPAPRITPVKMAPDRAAKHFKLDTLWRPADYIPNRFEPETDGTIIDRATGLRWQQSGKPFPANRQQAQRYVAGLNEKRHAAHNNWRLPTVEELITLLRPAPRAEDLCIEPVFDPTQRWLWSADRRSFTSAYYVDLVLGFVGWQDNSAPFYVRAVHSR